MSEQFTKIEFNYTTFKLQPYSGTEESSSNLLKKLINDLKNPDTPSIGIIDRFEKRKGTEKRRLAHIPARFTDKGRRYYGRLGLLKDKASMLWDGKDAIEAIDTPEGKKLIDVTNYVIDFGTDDPILMVEFNSSGPRISDVEYYFRQALKESKIAKSINYIVHLDIDIDDLESRMSNVFSINVKVKAGNLLHSKSLQWFNPLKGLADSTGYQDVKMEFFYGRKKDNRGNYERHTRGLDFARNIIDWLKQKQSNLEKIDDLKMAYSVQGKEEILDLDFLKNKTTSVVSIPKAPKGLTNRKEFIELVGMELNYYLTNAKTHKEGKND